MNEKAFNLMTALVAITLVVIAFLFVNIMTEREKTTSQFVAGIEKKSRVEALLNLTRADALQTINFGIRRSIEEWVAEFGSNNSFYVPPEDWTDWAKLKDKFIRTHFGVGSIVSPSGTTINTGFARRITTNIKGLFNVYGYTFGSFKVAVEIPNPTEFDNAISEIIFKSLDPCDPGGVNCTGSHNGLIEVIPKKCDLRGMPKDCEFGTFYITLRLNPRRIKHETYEKLPLISIEDLSSGTIIKDPVLPRNDVRFYVPLRIFKALSLARRFAHFRYLADSEKNFFVEDFPSSGIGILNGSDYGFYSGRMMNEFQAMQLGMCDYGICNPRDNPYLSPKKVFVQNKACPGSPTTINLLNSQKIENLGEIKKYYNGPEQYNPSNNSETNKTLVELAKARIEWIFEKAFDKEMLGTGYDNTFKPEKPVFTGTNNSRIIAISTPSKIIKQENDLEKLISDPFFNLDSDVPLPNNPATDILTGNSLAPKNWYCPQSFPDAGMSPDNYYFERYSAIKGDSFVSSNPGLFELSLTDPLYPFYPSRNGFAIKNGKPNFSVERVLPNPATGEKEVKEKNSNRSIFDSAANMATCSSLTEISVVLAFTETNKKYIVNKKDRSSITYRINMVIQPLSFKNKLNVNRKNPVPSQGCFFEESSKPFFGVSPEYKNTSIDPNKKIERGELDREIGWTCYYYKRGVLAQPSGCYPKKIDMIGS